MPKSMYKNGTPGTKGKPMPIGRKPVGMKKTPVATYEGSMGGGHSNTPANRQRRRAGR